jgi:hypothetical protein
VRRYSLRRFHYICMGVICLYLGRKLVRARGHVMKFFVMLQKDRSSYLDSLKAFSGVIYFRPSRFVLDCRS